MKYCPNCQTQYTDDSLKFCLQDGTPLVEVPVTQMKTADFGETETVVSNRRTNQANDYQTNSQARQNYSEGQTLSGQSAPPKKSRIALAVALTILLMLLLFGGIGVAAWLYLRKPPEIAKNMNAANNSNQTVNKVSNNAADNKKTPSPTPKSSNSNTANSAANANTATLPPVNAALIKKEVAETIDGWKSAAEAQNLDAQMEKYADTVDYYTKKDANVDFVRQDKQRAFSQFETIEMTISNLSVTPDATGNRATAIFDKEWNFESDEKNSTGKVKTQLDLQSIHGQWLITGEKDLKVYYKN